MSIQRLKGYNSTKSPVPLKVQNLVIRDYCNRNGHTLLLPNTEFVMEGSYLILRDYRTLNDCDGFVSYSMLLAPEEEWKALNKDVHFALENHVYPRDKDECRIIWALRRN